jgi:hypothetical protein
MELTPGSTPPGEAHDAGDGVLQPLGTFRWVAGCCVHSQDASRGQRASDVDGPVGSPAPCPSPALLGRPLPVLLGRPEMRPTFGMQSACASGRLADALPRSTQLHGGKPCRVLAPHGPSCRHQPPAAWPRHPLPPAEEIWGCLTSEPRQPAQQHLQHSRCHRPAPHM